MWVEFVNTNAMKSPEFNSYRLNIWFLLSLIALATEIPGCNDCELFDVNEVIDSNTVLTSKAEIHLYPLYRVDQPAD
ncbi:MAG: hypothetical protein OSB68_01275 [Dehalococcoidia bacterium]|nr:hypothetical protein [Dehalococcoidia bacterium]